MKTTDGSIKNVTIIDFTGSLRTAIRYDCFGPDVVTLIRRAKEQKLVVIVDYGYGFSIPAPYAVRDHINLTGTNPLVGPNDAIGERFPSVNGVYINHLGLGLQSGVAAGLRPGVVPTNSEWSFVRSLGADFYCYNLVPAMIVAAHAGFRVLGLVVPEGADPRVCLDSILSE